MPAEIQFKIGDSNPANRRATLDGQVIAAHPETATVSFADYETWVNGGPEPTWLGAELSEDGRLRQRKRMRLWRALVAPGADPEAAIARMGVAQIDGPGAIKSWLDRWGKLRAAGWVSNHYGVKDFTTHGIIVVEATVSEIHALMERPEDPAADPLAPPQRQVLHKGPRWAIDYRHVERLGDAGKEILARWIDPTAAVPPVRHPATGQPFPLASLKKALSFG